MTLTGTAKPGVSPATLAGQIDLLKGNPGGDLLQLDITIIGRLEIYGYNFRFNKSFSYVC
ncbi:5,10-methylene-tetrahydrofolate dehydrogenase/methenyl tetrahydrofolate cyclohydrolase [Rhizobium sp. BK650]|nr:5,10-methylene-tetrahydrofolate dehydrogenase/methenyl tetrahydrofolate cyclohydrolase [Rhizobium sp. BK650]